MEPPEDWPEEAVSQVYQLERRNRELLARIMRIQGEKDNNQITDIEIQVGFLKLRGAIFSCIQAIHRRLREKQHGWSFKDVLRRQLRDNPPPGKRHRLEWLTEHSSSTCILVVLSSTIWRCIDANIFQSELHDNYQIWFPIGMSATTNSTFEDITNHLEAQGDRELANRWRSTTLVALVGTKAAHRARSEQTRKALWELRDSLCTDLGLENSAKLLSEFLPRLQECVLDFAADLYQRIACSRHQYRLESPKIRRGQPFSKAELGRWDLKNTADWIDVNGEDDVEGLVCCLFPGVRRRQSDSNDELSVVKPLILVYDESSPGPLSYTTLDSEESESEFGDFKPAKIGPRAELICLKTPSSCKPNLKPLVNEPQGQALPVHSVSSPRNTASSSKRREPSKPLRTKTSKQYEKAPRGPFPFIFSLLARASESGRQPRHARASIPPPSPTQRGPPSQRHTLTTSTDNAQHRHSKATKQRPPLSRRQSRQTPELASISTANDLERTQETADKDLYLSQRRSSEFFFNSMEMSSSASTPAPNGGRVWPPSPDGMHGLSGNFHNASVWQHDQKPKYFNIPWAYAQKLKSQNYDIDGKLMYEK